MIPITQGFLRSVDRDFMEAKEKQLKELVIYDYTNAPPAKRSKNLKAFEAFSLK